MKRFRLILFTIVLIPIGLIIYNKGTNDEFYNGYSTISSTGIPEAVKKLADKNGIALSQRDALGGTIHLPDNFSYTIPTYPLGPYLAYVNQESKSIGLDIEKILGKDAAYRMYSIEESNNYLEVLIYEDKVAAAWMWNWEDKRKVSLEGKNLEKITGKSLQEWLDTNGYKNYQEYFTQNDKYNIFAPYTFLQACNNLKTKITTVKNIDVRSLNLTLPKGMTMKTEDKITYEFLDDKNVTRGNITPIIYLQGTFQKNNHCMLIGQENLDMPIGVCKIYTVNADNGSAASGLTGTHPEYTAIVSVKGTDVGFYINFIEAGSEEVNYDNFIKLLEGLSIK